MNIDKAMEILQAKKDGKIVQRKSEDGEWVDWSWSDTGLVADLGYFQIRVKPEPIEIWVNVYPDGHSLPHDSKADAEAAIVSSSGQVASRFVRTAHLREVLE